MFALYLTWTAPSDLANSYAVNEWNGSAYASAPNCTITNNGSAYTATIASLAANTGYSFEITATDNCTNTMTSQPIGVTTVPNVPTNVAAGTVNDTSAQITWTDASGASGYTILRATSATGPYLAVGTISDQAPAGSLQSFTDTTVSANTNYWYEILATNAGGTTATSDPVAIPTAPQSPQNVTATAEDTQTTLSWAASPGGSSYKIYQENGLGTYVNITNTSAVTFPTTTTAVITGLTNGTSYSYKLSAVNTGESNLSSAVSVTPAASTVEFLTATPASTSEIDLAWNLNTIGAQSIEVDRSTDGSTWTALTTTLPGTALNYADTTAAENTQYYYQVRAIYPSGSSPANSPFSTPASASTLAAITNLSASAPSSGPASEIDLSWTTNIANSTGIIVKRSTDGGQTYSQIASLANSATTYDDTGRAENSVYYYQVYSLTASGASEEIASTSAEIT